MRVVLCYPVEDQHLQQIRRAIPDAEVVDAGQERIPEEILNADIFIGHSKVHPLPWAEVVRQGRLRWIQSSAAGLDHCLAPTVISSEIRVSSASGLFAHQVAEQTMSLLLGLIRSQPDFFRAQTQKQYVRLATDDLRGQTVGIVGFGGNGQRIAEVLAPWNVRLLATDRFPEPPPPHVEAVWPDDRLPDLLAQSDTVILCVPLNRQTHHLIGTEQLGQCKPGARLINVARGPVVDEAALVAALENGTLSGAGLDVAEVEPLPTSSPLWEMPNVMITPHVGAQSAKRVDDTTDLVCENLARYLAGKPLRNEVDKELGFPRPEQRR
ncbi:MAG: D-2-hydroxyacid dehydrogenase [Planctomycetales bacterium]|nr:D-2-hydroxyacid dehydrogenase [Planctomycetales bacterium]